MKISWKWVQRRWYEFKMGDSGYLRYFISFGQFIILVYVLGVERFPWMEAVFTSMGIFAVVFFCCYVPICILIGHYFHRKRQQVSENIIASEQNPVAAYYFYMLLQQNLAIMQKLGLSITSDYLEMMDYWKQIAGSWRPKR